MIDSFNIGVGWIWVYLVLFYAKLVFRFMVVNKEGARSNVNSSSYFTMISN